MANGTIRRLITERGFGFIQTVEGKDLFFHRSELQNVGYDSLREGQQVEFEVRQGRDGRPQAVKVRLAQPKTE
jgi:CspA family cold shock protein